MKIHTYSSFAQLEPEEIAARVRRPRCVDAWIAGVFVGRLSNLERRVTGHNRFPFAARYWLWVLRKIGLARDVDVVAHDRSPARPTVVTVSLRCSVNVCKLRRISDAAPARFLHGASQYAERRSCFFDQAPEKSLRRIAHRHRQVPFEAMTGYGTAACLPVSRSSPGTIKITRIICWNDQAGPLIYKPTKFNNLPAWFAPRDYFDMIGFFAHLPRLLSSLWRRWLGVSTPGSYRPEQHYMRGPRPKTRTKGGKET